MSLTNLLLFLILVTLATYTFMPWKGIDKGSKLNIFIQFISWAFVLGVALFVSYKLGFIQ